jgi:hypothetical protein
MSNITIAQVEKFEILPSNQPANNTYSFRKGNPIITFNIGSTNKLLQASSVRINGKLTVRDAAGAVCNNNNIRQGAGTQGCATNGRLGVNACFQNINIASNETNQTLESVRQYGRLCATILPSTHSSDDFISNSGSVELNPGMAAVGGNLQNNTVHFSAKLYCGMLNGGNQIPMGVNGVRGLNITLELVSDQQFLSGAGAQANAGGYYELSNLSLSGNMLVPDVQTQSQLAVPGKGAFEYNSYNNLYSVIDSNDATQTYNLANSNVLSVFHNFLPVNAANTYGADSFSTNLPQLTNAAGTIYNAGNVNINKVSFSRGGLKLGLDYDLDETLQAVNGRPQVGILMNALSAVPHNKMAEHAINQPLTYGYSGNDENIFDGVTTSQGFASVDLNARNFAIGLNTDPVSGVGIDFRGQSYSTRIQSSLDGKSPNAVYTYVLNKNTLIYGPQGIMVQS